MNVTSIGDLAQSLVQRTRSTQLKQTIGTLTQELASGRTQDVSGRLGGDYSYLLDIDRSLSRLDGFKLAATEAAARAGAAQASLGQMSDLAQDLGGLLVSVSPSNLDVVAAQMEKQAFSSLQSTISALNTDVTGRALFGGTAIDRAPLGSAETLLAALRSAVAGAGTAADVITAADAWFAATPGFASLFYNGSDQSLAPLQVGPGEQVEMPLRADDPVFRSLLRNTALAALATDPALGYGRDLQNDLLRSVGEGLLGDQVKLTGLQSDLGFSEARIDEARTRNASARSGLEIAKTDLLAADPYDTATRLQEAQFHLESLYSVTARSSRLSLLSFLR